MYCLDYKFQMTKNIINKITNHWKTQIDMPSTVSLSVLVNAIEIIADFSPQTVDI